MEYRHKEQEGLHRYCSVNLSPVLPHDLSQVALAERRFLLLMKKFWQRRLLD